MVENKFFDDDNRGTGGGGLVRVGSELWKRATPGARGGLGLSLVRSTMMVDGAGDEDRPLRVVTIDADIGGRGGVKMGGVSDEVIVRDSGLDQVSLGSPDLESTGAIPFLR